MRCSRLVLSLTFLTLTALALQSDDDGLAGGGGGRVVAAAAAAAAEEAAEAAPVVPNQQTHDKSTNKLGVQGLHDEDNHPTPEHLKQPLDPYKNGGGRGLDSDINASDKDPQDDVPDSTNYNAFLMSISMIIVSEIGDKTFLIAALMAMRNSRVIVFSAAFTSLVVMTVLSGIVGHALPALISQRITQFLASALFAVFGFKLWKEGLGMSKNLGVDEELAEVEEEIASNKLNSQLGDMEDGDATSSASALQKHASKSRIHEIGLQIQDLASFVLSPVWIQVFVMTFLGEWGDRSQIATIAMAAGSEYWYVILGAIIGHGLCTAAACLGGKLLAKKISMRNVTLGGAVAFFVFAILYFYDAFYNIES
ncbi:uncharacterized protein LODBEIA_P24580 [Lodderomyces beijingensis]|uniref:GDT1 family protein n=1 Tax=Lodderomyces beijingensis TaxID=1775926 RepID=A0ABP0ZJB1_9ASCO